MSAPAENKNRFAALGFTIGFHALLFLLFLFTVFITPIPPFEIKPVPEIEIGLGMEGMGENAGGSGQNDNDIASSEEVASTPTATNDAANIVTDDAATEVHVKTNPNSKTEPQEDPKTSEEEKASQELLAALAKLKSKNKHDGKGEGDGHTGGSGSGTSTGVGDGGDPEQGNGHFHGQGGSGGYDLKGRMLVKKPDRLTDATEEGVVVVEIIVNQDGKVIKATPGQRGSTTMSSSLYAKARQAALGVKFNVSPDGAKEQRGTYTFVFTLE